MLGAILVSRNKTNVTGALTKAGVPTGQPHGWPARSGPAAAGGHARLRASRHALVHDVQLAFAHSTQTVFYIMAGVMAATFVAAVRWLPRGRVEPGLGADALAAEAGAALIASDPDSARGATRIGG